VYFIIPPLKAFLPVASRLRGFVMLTAAMFSRASH